jgi:4-aminobutyrate aminotransferase
MNTNNLPFGEQLPEIVISPPGPRSRELTSRLAASEMPAASGIPRGDVPVFWEKSRGCNIIDVDGNRYVDITGGFFVTNVGHSNPRIVQAIQSQAGRLLHSMGCTNPNRPRVELAEKLASITPLGLESCYIANSGGEAVDMALKTARLFTKKHTVIAFQGGFHGKTMASLAVTAQNYFRTPWMPFLTGVVHSPYAYCYRCPFKLTYPTCDIRCADYLEHLVSYPSSGVSDIAAVIFEPVQGQGGVIVPPPEFLPRIMEICRRHDILVIADEIITGFGRTGKFFGCDHYGIVPDFIILGKGMASGFPVSAMVTTKEIAACWGPEQHTSTFLGHPVGCAAALAGIQEIEDRRLPERSAQLGAKLRKDLGVMAKYPLVGDIRSQGLMAAIELVKNPETKEAAVEEAIEVGDEALKRGLMATLRGGAFGNCIRIAPPLTITEAQLEFAIHTLDECLSIVQSSR